jgi:hypothetical protein
LTTFFIWTNHLQQKAAERLGVILRSFKERPGYSIANGKMVTTFKAWTKD